MTTSAIASVAPCLIVRHVPGTLTFYRDKLGFDIMYQGPEPNDVFFGIVNRGSAMVMVKAVGIDPVPNHTRDVKQGVMRWDAYFSVPDPDALSAEFAGRGVEFSTPLEDTHDGLRGFEIRDPDGYLLFFGRPR